MMQHPVSKIADVGCGCLGGGGGWRRWLEGVRTERGLSADKRCLVAPEIRDVARAPLLQHSTSEQKQSKSYSLT